MGKEGLNETQEKLLEMLKWYHGFCEKNGLRYYIVGGTMLGAVRHQGFIPWDDDIDVGMPRDDYDRFVEKCKGIQEERYIVEAPKPENPEFQYLYAKIYDTSTTLIENVRKPIERGIFIDVFPLDGIGETEEKAKVNYSRILKKINFEMMIVCAIRKERKWYKNLGVLLGRMISPLVISERNVNQKINKMCEERSFDKERYVGNLMGNWGMKEVMPREFFGKPKRYMFEGLEVYGPEEADLYLRKLYGVYMELPPIEKRVSHHDYIFFDLNKSYLSNSQGGK